MEIKLLQTRVTFSTRICGHRWLSLALLTAFSLASEIALAQSGGFMTSYETEALGDGLYSFRYGPYRNIFLIGDEGVIVTDPLKAPAAAALRSEVAKLTNKPVKYVAYSHSHWDHAAGGEIFKREGAVFVAQEKCGINMAETPRSDVVPPDVVFADRITLSVGDRALEMHYFGPNHSDCLAVMVAKPANIAFIVDLANPPTGWHLEWNPTVPDTYFWNLIPSLMAIEEFARKQGINEFVGGHITIAKDLDGKPAIAPPVGGISAVLERRLFWEMVITAVSDEMAKGTFAELVPSRLDRTELEARIGEHERNDMSMLLRRVASYVYTGW